MGVTSPPYNKRENKKGWLVKNVKYHNSSDKKPENKYQQEQIDVLNELFRITKPGGSFFIIIKLDGKGVSFYIQLAGYQKQNGALDKKLFGIGE